VTFLVINIELYQSIDLIYSIDIRDMQLKSVLVLFESQKSPHLINQLLHCSVSLDFNQKQSNIWNFAERQVEDDILSW